MVKDKPNKNQVLRLVRRMNYGIEVHVVRGFKYDGSPSGKVYVYDGLYKVVESWLEAGKSCGFTIDNGNTLENEFPSSAKYVRLVQSPSLEGIEELN
ncbi:histone-lysine N-methyltransferase family member SUVH9-like protein [Tanacetum coccineum]|uniref:Histone-lysine N-methyltransferase family member SUVH9-like protein n=1 Tax=Tanacetum coccineum TaxID=301880 RepID=A0ABQ5BZ25_9ASTR